jgi:hypothetical protein
MLQKHRCYRSTPLRRISSLRFKQLERKPIRGREPREKGLERGWFICLSVLSSREFLDPSTYHPVVMVVVPYREEYNSIALPGRLPLSLNKDIPPCDLPIGNHILSGGGILLGHW